MPDLASFVGNPLLLGLALFAATFFAEDAATIAAGVLVGSANADPFVALCAVILGTAIGDLALYGTGRFGSSTRWGAKLRHHRDVARILRALAQNVLGLLVIARFVPGLRLPVYTASGMAGVPFRLVALVVLLSTPIWTSLLFEIARNAGARAAHDVVSAALLLGLILGVLMLAPRGVRRLQMK